VAQEQLDSVFDIANEEYKAGSYENAVILYEGLISAPGAKAADAHYNIGNASFKLKEYGKSIAAYRRALRLAPRDQDTIANLRFVRETVVDRIDQPRSAELWREIFFFHYGLSGAETEIVFLCAYLATALFAAACLLHGSRTLRWLALAGLCVTVIFGASIGFKWRAAASPSEGVVVAEETDVHTGPGDKYMVSFNLHDGAELSIRKHEQDWYQIELPDGRRGWIEESHVEAI